MKDILNTLKNTKLKTLPQNKDFSCLNLSSLLVLVKQTESETSVVSQNPDVILKTLANSCNVNNLYLVSIDSSQKLHRLSHYEFLKARQAYKSKPYDDVEAWIQPDKEPSYA